MSAGTYNMVIDQGADFAIQLTIKENGVAKNITGYSARGQLRTSYKASVASASFTCTVTDATNGVIRVELAHATSSALSEGVYFYDIEIYTAGNASVTRLLQGKVTLNPEVTRA